MCERLFAGAARADGEHDLCWAYARGGGGSGALTSDKGAPSTLGMIAELSRERSLAAVSPPNASDVTQDAIARQHSACADTGLESCAGGVDVASIDA